MKSSRLFVFLQHKQTQSFDLFEHGEQLYGNCVEMARARSGADFGLGSEFMHLTISSVFAVAATLPRIQL